MDLRSENAFWPIKNGLIASSPALSHDESCDVAVIGGGITGALVAYGLVSEGVETVLFDKRDFGEKAGSYCSRIVAFRSAKGFSVMNITFRGAKGDNGGAKGDNGD